MSASPTIAKKAIEVQTLSMQWLDLSRAGKLLKWDAKKLTDTKLGKIAKGVVQRFNAAQPHESSHFHKHTCAFQDTHYQLKVYAKATNYTPGIVQDLTQRGAEDLKKKKGNEILLFFCRTVPEREVVILTSDQAWRVVRECVHHRYPIQIAEKILDPSKIVEITRRCLVGPNLVETFLHPSGSEFYKTSSLYYLVESVKCTVKTNASLMGIHPFAGSNNEPTVKITSGGLLRIMKKLTLEDYPNLFRLFYLFTHDLETYSITGKLESRDSQFEFLNFIQPAQIATDILNAQMVRQIWTTYTEGRPLPAYLRHKYLSEFLAAKTFEIQYQQGGRFESLGSRCPSLQELIEALHEYDPELTEKGLLTTFKDCKMRYTASATGQVYSDSLIQFLETEILYQNRSYFKIRGMWYQLSADFNALFIEDFRTVLKHRLLRSDDPGHLPHPWKGNKPQDLISRPALITVLGTGKGIVKFMAALDKAKMSYVTSKGVVNQTRLLGTILEIPVIAKNQKTIEDELAKVSKTSLKARLKKLFPKDCNAIMKELEAERPLLVIKKQAGKTTRRVLNPAAYPLKALLGSKSDDFLTYLENLYTNRFKEDEAVYNRSYLYDKTNSGKPFGPKEGYLVFDRVLPNNIEPCDVVKYDARTTRLYHVKEELGQHTRDACSQILNAAKLLRSALSTHQPQDFLQLLWKECVGTKKLDGWRAMVKTQIETLGQNSFFKIFTERRIVFVYAFLQSKGKSLHEETSRPTMLSYALLASKGLEKDVVDALKQEGYLDSHKRLTGKFYAESQTSFSLKGFEERSLEIYKVLHAFGSISDSTLAKLELIHVERELKALNFDFEICEIARADTAESPDSLSYEGSETVPEDGEEAESVTEVETQVVPIKVEDGPSGLVNITNSCYMNASLQALYYLDEIRNLIVGEDPIVKGLSKVFEDRNKNSLIALRSAIFQNKGPSILTGSRTAQQDAHELLVFLFEKVKWLTMTTHTYFSYMIKNVNDRQGHFSQSSPCNHLSIPFQDGESLETSINNYFKKDPVVDVLDPLKVTYKKKTYNATHYNRQEQINAFPNLLMIHIKRFDNFQNKLPGKVIFSEDRTVQLRQKAADQPTSYQIVSIVNHHGDSMQAGHYTSDILDTAGEEERWIHCNDSWTSLAEPVNPEEDAYVVFLKKVN